MLTSRFVHEMKPWWAPRGKNWLIPNLIINTGLKWEVKWVMKGKPGKGSDPPLTKPRANATIEYPQDPNVWSSSRGLRFYWQFIIKCSGGFPNFVTCSSTLNFCGVWTIFVDKKSDIFYKSLLSYPWHPNRSRSTPLLMPATKRVLRFILS